MSLPRAWRFALVGAAGFACDALALKLLIGAGLGPLAARFVSVALAAGLTWRLNRRFAFGASAGSQLSEAVRYGLVVALSSAVNYAVYAGALLALRGLDPVLALVLGSAAALTASYLGFSRFAFRPPAWRAGPGRVRRAPRVAARPEPG